MVKLLERLFQTHYQDVYRYLYSLTRDAALAEDLASETFLEAVTALTGFRGQSDVRTWLFTIAHRRWAAHLKKQKRSPAAETLSLLLESPLPGPEERAMAAELAGRVAALLEGEPPRTRTVVELRLAGLSFYEIGQKTGLSETSARVIFFRARQRLKDTLEKEGYFHD